MKNRQLHLAIGTPLALATITLLILSLIAFTIPALAQGSDYILDWWTVDGGGGTSSSGSEYTLHGTAGQPDAGTLSNGDYTLTGGFWSSGAAAVTMHHIYLPLVLRQYP